jgi:hypothetical protein
MSSMHKNKTWFKSSKTNKHKSDGKPKGKPTDASTPFVPGDDKFDIVRTNFDKRRFQGQKSRFETHCRREYPNASIWMVTGGVTPTVPVPTRPPIDPTTGKEDEAEMDIYRERVRAFV